MKKALIHYFSGTGNTKHMASKLGSRLREKGYEVEYDNMEDGNKNHIKYYSIQIFAYPIYAFGTPAIVLKYLRGIKPGNGCKTSIVCTCGGFEGQSLKHVGGLLKRKGYDVVLSHALIYPDNWTQVVKPSDQETINKMILDGDREARDIAAKIAKMDSSIKKVPVFHQIWAWIVFLLFSLIGRRVLGKVFIGDKNCTACGKCERECPVKAIQIKNGKPQWNWSCENCQRCMNICPAKAIQTSPLRFLVFAVSGIGMIFGVVRIDNHIHMDIILNISTYIVLTMACYFIFDKIMNLLQRSKFLSKFFEVSYTKKYPSYFVGEDWHL